MTAHDILEVRGVMQIWDWMIDMTKKSTEKVLKWSQENRERRREMTREAMVRYRERHKNDQEYLERERETSRRTSAKYRKKMKETMTPEQLEEKRRMDRERAARYRARKKEREAQANEEKGKSPEA